MKNNISIKILLGLVVMVTLFHMALIAKAIPYEIAWGGRLQSDSEMYVFETLSIFVNLYLGAVLLMKGNYIKYQFKKTSIDKILWVFLVLFILNTFGNLLAKTTFERSFAGLTLVFALLIWIILKTGKN